MNDQRRKALKAGGGAALLSVLAAAGILVPVAAHAEWNTAAFGAKTLDDALKALGAAPADSREIEIIAPEVAENGAAVSIEIEATLPDVSLLAILVERNPNPLAATFRLPAGTEPSIKTRIKMAESSRVVALVRSGDRFFMAQRDIQVTVGGCSA